MIDFGPAVEHGKLRYLSVSAVTKASPDQDGCLRAWWFDKVAKVETPSRGYQDLGKAVHAEIEHFLKTGENVLGPIARVGKHFLPVPRSVETEVPFGIRIGPDGAPRTDRGLTRLHPDLVALGIPFVGFIDAVNESGTYVDPEGHTREDDAPELIDWKTSKDVARYAKPASALVRTVQMVGYAKYALGRFGGDRVRVSHVTFPTAGPKTAVKSTAVLDRLTVDGRWLKVSDTVAGMVQAAKETDPSRVDANYNACGSYGGCPYREVCPRSALTALRDALGGKTESFMGVLEEVMGGAPAPTGRFGGARPGIDEMPKGMSIDDRKAWIAAVQEFQVREIEAEEEAAKAKAAPPAQTAAPAKGSPLKAKDAKQTVEYLIPFGAGLVPAEYIGLTKGGRSFLKADGNVLLLADDDGIYSTTITSPDAAKPGQSGPTAEPIPPEDNVPANVRAAADAHAKGEPPPVVKERKPRKKATETTPAKVDPEPVPTAPFDIGKPAEERGSDLVVVAAEAGVDPDARPVLTPEGAAVATGGFTLLVNCAPVAGTTARNLSAIVEVVHEALRETFKCVDVRDASSDRLAFGKWKGAFAAGIRTYHEQHPLTGYVVAEERGSELVALAVEALAPMASMVVRGF